MFVWLCLIITLFKGNNVLQRVSAREEEERELVLKTVQPKTFISLKF